MLKFLNKPYPFNDDLRHNAKIILFISLGVLAFLLIFQPIEISSFSTMEIVYLVTGIAASTFLALSINLIVIPSIFPKFFYNNIWNIKREILWNLWILLTISTTDLFFYSSLFNIFDITFTDIIKIILLGLLPVAVLIIINQDRLLRSHLKSAQQLNDKLLAGSRNKINLINFKSDYKNDDLTINPKSLILIKSADNYIEIYFSNENTVKKQLVRSSLKKANETIAEFDNIIRCHRTFIVNMDHIKEIHGNTQGYRLHFEGIDFQALVSPKYINEFSSRI